MCRNLRVSHTHVLFIIFWFRINNTCVWEGVNFLVLVCSLSSHRHSYIGFIFYLWISLYRFKINNNRSSITPTLIYRFCLDLSLYWLIINNSFVTRCTVGTSSIFGLISGTGAFLVSRMQLVEQYRGQWPLPQWRVFFTTWGNGRRRPDDGFGFTCRLGCQWGYHRVWIVHSTNTFVRHVDSSTLTFSLSSYRPSFISLIFSSRFNKQQ